MKNSLLVLILKYLLIVFFMIISLYLRLNDGDVYTRVVIVVVFCLIYTKILKIKLNYYMSFLFVIPSIGFIFILVIELMKDLLKKEGEILELSNFEKDILYVYDIKKFNVEESLDKLPWNVVLDKGTPQEKKNIIIDKDFFDIKTRIEILRKGLKDEDLEVQHYSATVFNSIDKNFRDEIRKEKNPIKKLEFYINYCESGILEDDILNVFIEKTENHFKSIINLEDVDILLKLKFYNLKNEIEKIKEITLELLDKNTMDLEIKKYLLRVFYDFNEIEFMKKIEKVKS